MKRGLEKIRISAFEAVKYFTFRVIALFHVASSNLMKFHITAIITLMGANDSLELALWRLILELWKYFI